MDNVGDAANVGDVGDALPRLAEDKGDVGDVRSRDVGNVGGARDS